MVGLAAVLPSVMTGKLLQFIELVLLSQVSRVCLAQVSLHLPLWPGGPVPPPPNQEIEVVSSASSHLSDYTGGWDSESTLRWSEGSDVDR